MIILLGVGVASVAGGALADTVVLKDGTRRSGTVVSQDSAGVRLRMDDNGMRVTVAIPADQIAYVEKESTAAATKPATAPATTTTKPVTPVTTAPAVTTRGFMRELLASATGKGPDSPARLNEAQRTALNKAYNADLQGKHAEVVDALLELHGLMAKEPGRLNGVSRRVKGVDFGVWLAGARWAVASKNVRGGSINWGDPGVLEVEKPALIAILRTQTEPALAPLRPFMGAMGANGAVGQPTKEQLAAIQVGNALELRDKSLFAVAVLSAQVKFEPEMPAVDRALLSSQLSVARRVLGRCNELAPQAQALAEKAAREKRIADEKARREALMNKKP